MRIGRERLSCQFLEKIGEKPTSAVPPPWGGDGCGVALYFPMQNRLKRGETLALVTFRHVYPTPNGNEVLAQIPPCPHTSGEYRHSATVWITYHFQKEILGKGGVPASAVPAPLPPGRGLGTEAVVPAHSGGRQGLPLSNRQDAGDVVLQMLEERSKHLGGLAAEVPGGHQDHGTNEGDVERLRECDGDTRESGHRTAP